MAVHDIGINAATGQGLVCDCGEHCGDLTAWHRHTVHTYGNPSPAAITLRGNQVHGVVEVAPGTAAEIFACTKVACSNHGNNRECWTVKYPDPANQRNECLYELPSEQLALELVTRGGVISMTHLYTHC